MLWKESDPELPPSPVSRDQTPAVRSQAVGRVQISQICEPILHYRDIGRNASRLTQAPTAARLGWSERGRKSIESRGSEAEPGPSASVERRRRKGSRIVRPRTVQAVEQSESGSGPTVPQTVVAGQWAK